MKKYKILYGFIVAATLSLGLFSCKDDAEQLIVPSITSSTTDYSVDYKEGTIKTDVASNVIYYATVDAASKKWLFYQFSDTCKTLTLKYVESDTIVARTGKITLTKGDASIVLTVKQAGNPDAGTGLKRVILPFTVTTGTYNILRATAADCAKIPVGSTVVFECSSGDVGSISFLDATYATFFAGSPVDGKITFVWTNDMAVKTASGGIMALLNSGLTITNMYCLYTKKALVYTLQSGGGYDFLRVTNVEGSKILVGSTVTFECSADAGSMKLMNPTTYATLAEGSPVNGKFNVTWTQAMVDATASGGIMTMLLGGVKVTALNYVYIKTKIVYTFQAGGGYNFLKTVAKESAKIPVGATVVFECKADAGTIRLMNPTTYATLAEGSPVNKKFTVIWTSDMAKASATGGIMAMLINGVEVTDFYSRN